MIKKTLNSKILKYLIALIYTITFYNGYKIFLNRYFDYLGYDLIKENTSNLVLTIFTFLFAIAPLFFFKGVRNISSFLCVFIYFLVYVPILFMFYFNYSNPELIIYREFLFFIGMTILFFADRFTIKANIELPSAFNLFKFILIIGYLFTFVILIVFRSNLKLVGFEDVYSQRIANRDLLTGPVGYVYIWLSNVILPICFTYGLYAKSRLYIFSAVFFSVVMYMALAAKSVLLLTLFIFLIYRLLRNRSLINAFNIIGSSMVLVMVISLQFGFSIFNSLLWMRTLSIGGYVTKYYDLFFTNHPHTYFSHINIVNLITQIYPYNEPLGNAVAREYFSADVNLNANFWATDGIAAMGDLGIIFSSVILFFVFVIFNTIAKNYNLLFVISLLIPFTLSLTNSSLFTSLFSGGAFFIFIFLSFGSTRKKFGI